MNENKSDFNTSQIFDSQIMDEVERRRIMIHPMNQRVIQLREESTKAMVSISSERAKLITGFYRTHTKDRISIPLYRALAFKFLMEHVRLPIEKDQLIVGLRGTDVKEVPTYPEICCHSLQDLNILSSRENNSYFVDLITKQIYKNEIIPFWKGKTMRDRVFRQMSPEWKRAYESGIFTEFMEQRPPGHTAGGDWIFKMGLLDIKKEIKKAMHKQDSHDETLPGKRDELKAMEIAADALISYARRYADELEKIVHCEKNPRRKQELTQMVKICRWVPSYAPRTFWEALQHYWFIHVGIVFESNPWDAFTPGRLDQHLYPFYKNDIEQGILSREDAKELLEAFFLKFNNQPAPPKVGITAQESATYNDFSKINLGGLKDDGSDGVNDVTYLLLDVLQEMRTVQPNTAVLISEKTPNEFLFRSLNAIRPGFGEPPLFNFDGIVAQLLRQGKSLEDARRGGCSGCVEAGVFGKESYVLTGYLNLSKILEITLNNGVDPLTKKQVGITTGDPQNFKNFTDLLEAFKNQLKYFIEIKMKGNDIIEQLYAQYLPVPFLSLWIENCVASARDYNGGGAKYNTQYIQFVGLGTVTDSLSTFKYHVFDKKSISIKKVLESLQDNYAKCEDIRQMFLNKTPKYGNDNDYVDDIAREVFNTCIAITEDYPSTKQRKAAHRGYFLPTTVHVYFGSVCGATPDGRKAGTPLSEGISPVQGSDRNGIAAVFRSVGKLDHVKTGGTLLNQRLTPSIMEEEKNLRKLMYLIRAFFRMGGHHVQFNVVSTELLRQAQKYPQGFQDLMVRVAGYSDYFVNLPKGLQEEIIARTEQKQ